MKTRICPTMKARLSVYSPVAKRKKHAILTVCKGHDLRWWVYSGVVGPGLAATSKMNKQINKETYIRVLHRNEGERVQQSVRVDNIDCIFYTICYRISLPLLNFPKLAYLISFAIFLIIISWSFSLLYCLWLFFTFCTTTNEDLRNS